MTVNIHQPSPEDSISLIELTLYRALMDYRVANGLPIIPLSKALTTTAARHAVDIVENIGVFRAGEPGENRGHSWSDAPFDGRDPATYSNMWFAPQRLGTGYATEGFEIATGYTAPGAFTMTPQKALAGWQASAGHDAVILNQGPWDQAWKAVGVGMYKGIANVWFGATTDPTGAPAIVGTTAAEVIVGFVADDTILGGGGNDTIDGLDGLNYLRGDDGDDKITGGAGFDDINGGVGNDTGSGGQGDDWVAGGKDSDLLFGGAGADVVYGNLGADTCEGGDGNDIVRGGQGNDVVRGGAGDDYVSGDRGDDTVTGGAGADVFHGSQDGGRDWVMDFSAHEGDRVALDPGTIYVVSQSGPDVLIDMGADHQMILVGVDLASLSPGWILAD